MAPLRVTVPAVVLFNPTAPPRMALTEPLRRSKSVVLVSVLVVLGVLSKDNEVTAFKACGVSVYRLAAPLLLVSLLLSGGLFAFNHYVVPGADRRQDALRAEIKRRLRTVKRRLCH